MDTPQFIMALMGAGGGGAALVAIINGFIKWLSGASSRERDRNSDAIAQRNDAIERLDIAEKDRDESDKKKRQAYEYASSLRRQLLENGINPGDWPLERTIPVRPKQQKSKEKKVDE